MTDTAFELGSPPRVWGQRTRAKTDNRPLRFTPTGVGTTTQPAVPALLASGSPPRVWGQRSVICHHTFLWCRFTPTGVGTTHDLDISINADFGSPPRVWGQRCCGEQRRLARPVHPHGCGDNDLIHLACGRVLRFTPTGVGTTNGTGHGRSWIAVHPHGCGDNAVFR